MKKILFYLVALCPLVAAAQDTFTIRGKIGTLSAPAKVYLLYQLGANKVLDSSAVSNGDFTITGQLIFPVQGTLVLDEKGVGISKLSQTADHLGLFLDKGDVNLSSSTSLAQATITGSKINDDAKVIMGQLQAVQTKAQALNAEASAAAPEVKKTAAFQNNMQARSKALQAEIEDTYKSFIKTHPDSFLSIMALSSLGGPTADAATIEPLYNSLAQNLKDTEPGKALKETITQLKLTGIGATAPDFEQTDINGSSVKLSSFRGKYVLIDFWASWCPPCRQENPNVVKAFYKYKGKNFTILGVSLDRNKKDWIDAIKNDGLAWTQVSDLRYWNNAAAALYFVNSVPQNYLIDPNGKIVAKNLRGADLENKLAELFGKI